MSEPQKPLLELQEIFQQVGASTLHSPKNQRAYAEIVAMVNQMLRLSMGRNNHGQYGVSWEVHDGEVKFVHPILQPKVLAGK